jgi:hypothetical protein
VIATVVVAEAIDGTKVPINTTVSNSALN